MIQPQSIHKELSRKNIVVPTYKQVGNYLFKETLSYGNFGNVYRAIHLQTGKVVAVKVINTKQNGGADEAYGFRALKIELSLMLNLKHKNVVQTFDIFKQNGEICIVMEYCETNLRKYLQKKRFYTENDLLKVFEQILVALEYLHSRGISHQKLNLDDILVLSEVCKLRNFGINRLSEHLESDSWLAVNHPKPKPKTPIVFKGLFNNIEDNIFSAGAILFYILYGRYPPQKSGKWSNAFKFDYFIQSNRARHPFQISKTLLDFLRSMLYGHQDNQRRLNSHQLLNQLRRIMKVFPIQKLMLMRMDMPQLQLETPHERKALDLVIFMQRNLIFREIFKVDYMLVTEQIRTMQRFPQQLFQVLFACLKIDQFYKYTCQIQADFPEDRRTITEYMFLLTYRCQKDIFQLEKKVEKELSHIKSCQLKKKVTSYLMDLKKSIIKVRGKWADKVTDIQNEWTSIISDRFSKTFYSQQSLNKDKFLTGIENFDYNPWEQIKYCKQYFQKHIKNEFMQLTKQVIEDPINLRNELSKLTKFDKDNTQNFKKIIRYYFKLS